MSKSKSARSNLVTVAAVAAITMSSVFSGGAFASPGGVVVHSNGRRIPANSRPPMPPGHNPGRLQPVPARPVVVRPPNRQYPVSRPSRPVVVVPVYPGARNYNSNARYGRQGRIIVRAPRPGNDVDAFVAQLLIQRSDRFDCDDLGALLTEISNDVLEAGRLPEFPTDAERRIHPGNRDEFLKKNRHRALKTAFRHPEFAKLVMSRLTEAFRGCNKECFDDGIAVGVISGTGFCAASLAVDGLPDDVFLFQQRLPVCKAGNYIGCQSGYTQAVNSTEGCLEYASGSFLESFNHYVSQDCHIE